MSPASEQPLSVAFGRFRVVPHRRELLADDRPIKLGGRAFDVLMALIEARGAVVGKGALLARAWPGQIVDENSLQAQIGALRKAFGVDRELIRTVSGRGYQFTGEIGILPANRGELLRTGQVTPNSKSVLPPTNMADPVSELIGRDEELREIANLAAAHRFVTLTGPGGIGKTRLALAVARQLLPQFIDGVWVVELAPLADPSLIPATVAAAVGLDLGSAGAVSAEGVAKALSAKRLLLVLDNCEHVIDAAAIMGESVLRAGLEARIIATSREPLRAEAEQIYPVPPLAVPVIEGEDPWRYGAVLLFLVRSRATGWHVAEDRRAGAVIAAICRRLDGIPLAIELAAARAAALGIEGLAARLDDRFRLLAGGRRTALPRHQTLRATLDWSYELLGEPERVILRRLGVFAGAFSLEAAIAIVASLGIAPSDVVESLSNLVAKSLVAVKVDGTAHYRLLDTTRAYAFEKLTEAGEREWVARRHAEYYRDLFAQAEVEWEAKPPGELLADYGPKIDDLRSALDWAFSPVGEASIGVALAAASVPIWFELSLFNECRGWMEKALGVVGAADRLSKSEMILQYAFGYSLMFAQGTNDRARAALTRANELAERLRNIDYQLRVLAGLASICHRLQDFHTAVALGRRAAEVVKTSSDAITLSMADWILGTSLQLLGEYSEALSYAQRTCARAAVPAVRRAHLARLGRDSFVSAGTTVALIRWIQGLPVQAAQTAQKVLADAEAGDHSGSLCLALTWCGCIIPLRLGKLRTAERAIARLKDHAQSRGLSAYYANSLCFEGRLAAKRGDAVTAERLLRAGLKNLQQTQSENLYTVFLTGLAEVLMTLARLDEALAAADEALQRTEQSTALSWMPEAIRIKGEVLLSCKGDTDQAEHYFRQSLDLAHRQGALSWELRGATSLARLLRGQDRFADAVALLQPVYDRFAEGFDTADLKAAQALLASLRELRMGRAAHTSFGSSC